MIAKPSFAIPTAQCYVPTVCHSTPGQAPKRMGWCSAVSFSLSQTVTQAADVTSRTSGARATLASLSSLEKVCYEGNKNNLKIIFPSMPDLGRQP